MTARVRPQQTRDVGPMLVRYWVDAVDGGPKFNQHWVNVSRGSAVRHCVMALVILVCIVWCLMIAVVTTRIKLLCLLERVEPCL